MEGFGVQDFIDDWPLFEYAWFNRTRVVQEVFNAKAVWIHCGQGLLPWSLILRVNNCIGRTKLRANSGYKARLPPLYAEIFDPIETERSAHLAKKLDQSARTGILDTFTKCLDLDATDPRDKIFAILQFGGAALRAAPGLLQGYKPLTGHQGLHRHFRPHQRAQKVDAQSLFTVGQKSAERTELF
jgi:hypothetical protein